VKDGWIEYHLEGIQGVIFRLQNKNESISMGLFDSSGCLMLSVCETCDEDGVVGYAQLTKVNLAINTPPSCESSGEITKTTSNQPTISPLLTCSHVYRLSLLTYGVPSGPMTNASH